MPVPVWRLTRRPLVRRAFYALADRGVVLSRIEQFEHALDSSLPDRPAPDGVTLHIESPGDRTLPDRMDDPHLTDGDRLVVAMADDPVGIQPVAVDRPVYVPPLDREVAFDGAYFWGLYVGPEWRRDGVATALVARALRVAARADCERVGTLVGSDNAPSKRVLRSVGFERTRVRSYYRLFGLERRSGRAV